MYRKLASKEIIYDIELTEMKVRDIDDNYDYNEVFKIVKTALNIDKEGYNIYIIDDFSKDKIENLIKYVNTIYKDRKAPKDICYVSQKGDKYPKVIFLLTGSGNVFKEILEEIKELYLDITFEFYNNPVCKEKDDITDFIEAKRNEYIEELISSAKEKGFYMKAIHNGFTFIPIKEGKEMTENEYDDLMEDNKKDILDNISFLKDKSKDILGKLKNVEEEQIEKVKSILKKYYGDNTKEVKNKYNEVLKKDINAIKFLDEMCENIGDNIIENYSMNYEDDETNINEVVGSYMVNVLVDNSLKTAPVCIFEEDPSVNNLIGSIEYENKNGVYSTDVTLVKSGSLLKANEGCVALRVNSLLSNTSSYYYLKKTLISEKVDFNYNRGYLELLSLNGLKPEAIPINAKVILIGDYQTYDLLYRYDEDFKKLFKIKAEYYPVRDIDENSICIIKKNVMNICKENNMRNLEENAFKEIFKYLSRVIECNKKIYLEKNELNKILTLANSKAAENNKIYIDKDDIIEVAYNEEIIEKNVIKSYKENKQFISVKGKEIGQVNGLSVIDGEYFKFGKPIRITCCCYNGNGNVFDVQKESNLSGNIHGKSVNILKGFINNLFGGYESIPVDFHLNFEQLYGYLDGDSASVAEIVAMVSALSKIPVNQNIAVTGSIDQFGRVQPIGGTNDKIEGFYKVCKEVDTIKDKGVIIPSSNIDNLVLSREVEESIDKGDFSIYSVDDIFDAIYLLVGKSKDEIMSIMEKEIKKYSKSKKDKRDKKE